MGKTIKSTKSFITAIKQGQSFRIEWLNNGITIRNIVTSGSHVERYFNKLGEVVVRGHFDNGESIVIEVEGKSLLQFNDDPPYVLHSHNGNVSRITLLT